MLNMPIVMNEETYYNTSEACKHLGVTRETLNNYVKGGRLRRYKSGIGRTSYYKLDDLNKFLELRAEDSTEGN